MREIERNDNEKNLTMETKITEDGEVANATTIIECINDTKWGSVRETKQLKESIGM